MNAYEKGRVPRFVLWTAVAVLCFCLWGCLGSPEERLAWNRLDAAQAVIVDLQADPATTPEQMGAAQRELVDAATEYALVQKDIAVTGWQDLIPDLDTLLTVAAGVFGLNFYRNRKAKKA